MLVNHQHTRGLANDETNCDNPVTGRKLSTKDPFCENILSRFSYYLPNSRLQFKRGWLQLALLGKEGGHHATFTLFHTHSIHCIEQIPGEQ